MKNQSFENNDSNNIILEKNKVWVEKFVPALYDGKMYIEGKNLIIDTRNVKENIDISIERGVFSVPLKNFVNQCKSDLDNVFENSLIKIINKKSYSIEDVDEICMWENDIFSQMNLDSFRNFENALDSKFNKKSKTYDATATSLFRMQLRNYLLMYNKEDRAELIGRIEKYNIFNRKDLLELGYYKNFNEETVLSLYNSENEDERISEKELYSIGKKMKVSERLQEIAKSNKKLSFSKKKAMLALIPKKELINLALTDRIPYNYLEYADVTKQDVLNEGFPAIVVLFGTQEKFENDKKEKKNVKNLDYVPEKIKITEDDAINEYGKNLTGSELLRLVTYGYVDSTRLLDVVKLNKVLKLSGEINDEKILADDAIVDFYEQNLAYMFLRRNLKMDLSENNNVNFLDKNDNLITPEFVQEFKNVVNDDERFSNISKVILENMKNYIVFDNKLSQSEKNEKIQNAILSGYDINLFDKKIVKSGISRDYLKSEYMNGNIDNSYILKLYTDGIIDNDFIKEFFTDDEIFDMYLNKKVPVEVVSLIENKEELDEKLLGAVMDEKMPLSDCAKLYFNGTITAKQLEDEMEFAPSDFDISLCIDKSTPFSKIKELFEKEIIDYSHVMDLRNNEVITDEQLKEIEETLNKKEFFNNLKGKTITLVTNREESKKLQNIGKNDQKKEKQNPKFESEKELIAKILGMEDDFKEYATIISYNSKGKATSLNEYKVYGSEENGLVIFEKERKENSVYIMPFYQAAYFLGAKDQKNGETEVEVKDKITTKDKKYLRSLSQVKPVDHRETFAYDLVNSACKFSKEYNEKYNSDKKYMAEVDEMCNEMRDEYRAERGLD